MSKYIVYTYQFAPLIRKDEDVPSLFKDYGIVSRDDIMRDKQKIFGAIFDADSGFVFSDGSQTFHHKELLNTGGVIVLRIANNKTIIQEKNFTLNKIPNNPSCIVVIDNRTDCQSIAIQQNGKSFSSTDNVANILKKSFNAFLRPKGLLLDIRRRFSEQSFWQIVDKHTEGIKSIKFRFARPNLPRVSDNIGEALAAIGKNLNASTTYELTAVDGGTLNLSKDDLALASLVKAAGDSGYPISILPAKKDASRLYSGKSSHIVIELPGSVSDEQEDLLFNHSFEDISSTMNEFK